MTFRSYEKHLIDYYSFYRDTSIRYYSTIFLTVLLFLIFFCGKNLLSQPGLSRPILLHSSEKDGFIRPLLLYTLTPRLLPTLIPFLSQNIIFFLSLKYSPHSISKGGTGTDENHFPQGLLSS